MATYKVIQDIEAEDKFVGPLTLRQFIYAAIFVVCGYLCFVFITKNVWFLMLPLLPIMLVSGFLAFPWGRDQPTEVWLAKARYYFKPRLRIWDQSGMQELVTITAPKKTETQLTNNLSQTEVKSRLKALADTIDSRGWALKDVSVNMYVQPGFGMATKAGTDRLVETTNLVPQAPISDIQAADDIMDEANNPTAQKLDKMIVSSAETRRKQVLANMDKARKTAQEPESQKRATTDQPKPDYWFMNEPPAGKMPPGYATFSGRTVTPGVPVEGTSKTALSTEERALLEKVHTEQEKEKKQPRRFGNMRVIKPLSDKPVATKPMVQAAQKPSKPQTPPPPVTNTPDPDILKLAINNDRNVDSLAREATAARKQDPPDEVVISLH